MHTKPPSQPSDNAIEHFLRLCLRGRWDTSSEAHSLRQSGALDWDILSQLAQRAGVAPLLYHTLRGQDILPPQVEADLRRAYHYTATRNHLLLSELRLALERLAQERLPCIVLKGPALLETVYGNLALRPMDDLDLLVRREDVPQAITLFSALGYTPAAEARPGATLNYSHAQLLRKNVTPSWRSGQALSEVNGPRAITLPLEIHWRLLESPSYDPRLDMSWFWQSTKSVMIDGHSALIFAPSAQLFHLCIHLWLHHHGEGMLRWFDIASLIRTHQPQIDWEQLLEQAQACHLLLPLQHTLPRITTEWGVPIPNEVIQKLQTLKASAIEARLFSRLAPPNHSVLRSLVIELANLPTWSQRLQFTRNSIFPSPEYMQRRYQISEIWLPFYYPYRWWLGLRSAYYRERQTAPALTSPPSP